MGSISEYWNIFLQFDFLGFYQNLPGYLNPVAFSIYLYDVKWYSLMYLVGFVVFYFFLKRRGKYLTHDEIGDFIIFSIAGVIVGGRLGYVLFYDLDFYLSNSSAIISPFQGGDLVGIYGMSYYGGLIGVVIASILFAKIKSVDFWKLADFVVPVIPIGYFFGRVGNFLNGELYGRATDSFLGMYFPGGGNILRHPSQLYEAFFEGFILFLILWLLRNRFKRKEKEDNITMFKSEGGNLSGHRPPVKFDGILLVIYFLGYGVIRFFLEFFREPDIGSDLFFNFFTKGQILSLIMVIFALALFYFKRKKEERIER